ncbi:MAG: CopG family transcriptional regulator [Oscillospiraceae bacterium]|nr:CopG family transcriptional regulator [Oscillospiraceae bacterium]
MSEFKKEPLIIKRRGEDGHKMITIRVREDTLLNLDKMATEINCSRNELINVMINYGIENIIIE